MSSGLIIDKNCSIKEVALKKYTEEDLYKKCGFKKADGFGSHAQWKIKMNGLEYIVRLFGKTTGRANHENKYDFPPPADNYLFFGSTIVVAFLRGEKEPCSLTEELWEKMYEKLFGGFEDLSNTKEEDDNEIDELANVPKKFKTKSGYLKDDFVVSDEDEIADKEGSTELSSSTEFQEDESSNETDENKIIDELHLEDIESELEEEEYESSGEELEI